MERGHTMLQKRKIVIFILISVVFLSLTVRLACIQLIQGKGLSTAASSQRLASSTIDKPRGEIVDKNLIPLTGRSTKACVVLEPSLLRGEEDSINKICEILKLDTNSVKREIDFRRVPLIFQSDEKTKDTLLGLGIRGVTVINSTQRYDNSSVARHILGYLNQVDQVGIAGIEKSYEDVLKTEGKNSINAITDAKDNLVEGIGYRIIKDGYNGKKVNIKLTIDYHIQTIVESVMEKHGVSGAIVVEDVLNGDIVSISSKPDYEQNKVENYLNSPKKELFNRAVASYNIGSIFKIISASQAFESGITMGGDYYFCSGAITLGNREFKCSSFSRGGHGMINSKDAFALSCNPYFIELGLKIGYSNLISMAEKFGLGKVTGLDKQGISESPGTLPLKDAQHTDGDIANLAIGQGSVMVTPVQIADVVATVANGGIKNQVNLVDSIIDKDGNKIKDLKTVSGKRIISKQTADKVKELMVETVSTGTGVKANIAEYGGAGGKTGSAETGQYINGEKVVHAWFAGYFPANNPKYSMAVFVENGKSGGDAAAPLFKEIAEEILKKKY